MTLLHGRHSRPPVLIINAAQEFGKLSAKARCFVCWQPVTQSLQYGPQQAIGTVFVLPPQPRVEIVDPGMGQLDCMIDAFEARRRSCEALH